MREVHSHKVQRPCMREKSWVEVANAVATQIAWGECRMIEGKIKKKRKRNVFERISFQIKYLSRKQK